MCCRCGKTLWDLRQSVDWHLQRCPLSRHAVRNDIDCLTIDNSVSTCKSDSPITDLGLFLTTSCLSAGLEATYSRCLLGLLLLSWSSLLPKWVFHVLAHRELMEDLQTNISVESGYDCAGNLCANSKSHGFAVCSCRLQANNKLAQQAFRDRGPSTQASLCSSPLLPGSRCHLTWAGVRASSSGMGGGG